VSISRDIERLSDYGIAALQAERNLYELEKSLRFLVGQQLNDHPHGIYNYILQCVEKLLIEEVLRHTKFNQSEASRILGISRGTLGKKIKEYGL
jgi:Fis family transcriptional regulator